jgi:hypothetical protein
MNHFLKAAYDAGADRALKEAGIRERAGHALMGVVGGGVAGGIGSGVGQGRLWDSDGVLGGAVAGGLGGALAGKSILRHVDDVPMQNLAVTGATMLPGYLTGLYQGANTPLSERLKDLAG